MNIQIFGSKKCKITKKAERWFSERGISYQLVDLLQKAMSPRELDSVLRFVSPEELIDENSPAYKNRGLAWMDFDIREELLEHPELIRTPVVRNGSLDASVGQNEEKWKRWYAESRA